ncbi:UNVERIFIED_CONTAM: hypothetical protein Sradi_5329300 [Sesamum radiatum]|uniref:RING-type E3 ubiquitin transferase n=1 Tax=Sesamum radiatum TaxID=300843 RepID=A0AAW2LQQ3_SESRA
MSTSLFYASLCFSLLTSIFITPAFSIPSYTDHCSSTVPESTTTVPTQIHSVPYFSSSYIIGGDTLLGKKPANQSYYYVGSYVRLRVLPNSYETIDRGVYKVEASLNLRSPYRYYSNRTRGNRLPRGSSSYHRRRVRGLIRFSLSGFWSETSRKLCMVGSGSREVEEGKNVNLDAVLKLHFASENPDIYTSVVSGTFESAGSANDPGYFDPILMFSFPDFPNYNYSLVSEELGGGSSGGSEVVKSENLSLEPSRFCSVLTWRTMVLEYATDCRGSQHCSPLGGGNGFLPGFLYLNPIQCSGDVRRVRYLMMFQNNSYVDMSFGLNSALIGEAVWDDKSRQLVLVACRVLNPVSHSGNTVGDCMFRLRLRYPSIWTIRNDTQIVGQLSSNRSVEDSGYFRKIDVRSYDDNPVVFPWLRYEYTELERAKGSCSVKKPGKKGNVYPDGHSYDMRFDMSVKNAKGKQFAWGFAVPVSVGDQLYETRNMFIAVDSMASAPGFAAISEPETSVSKGPLNISYRISINPYPEVESSDLFRALNRSLNLQHLVEITAEGVYNAEIGFLCMVGCRKLLSDDHNSGSISRDCEILVEVEFAALNGKTGGRTKGTIRSTRAKDDPLHFEDLSMSSSAFYTEVAQRSIWRMDLEITMVLISNTLSCIFVVLQLFHVKRNPEALSSMSLVMLLILSIGYMIPLVLNFEALFLRSNRQTLLLSTGGWVEINEVSIRVITMVAFLLQIRLVQLVWTAKRSNGDEKGSWAAEKKAAVVSLPMYVCGGLLTLLVNWTRNRYGYQAVSSSYNVFKRHSLWGDLRSYAGLILDGFLLPQVLLNVFMGSAEKALSRPFYVGISAVRLVPHAYDQYRAHNYPASYVNGTYYYANPTADFYSTAWNVIIPCGVIALAVIVFLQQRRGGRWILPRRFRELELYEKVPAVITE